MATLNTLRTRFGFVLTGVIALVLLAFIFSPNDFLSFAGNDPVVARIDGHDVTYSEYAREYDYVMAQSGLTQLDDQQAAAVYQTTWQSLVANHVVMPGLSQMGLNFGEAEYSAVVRGDIPTQTMYRAFANPQTGVYDLASLSNFVMSSRGNAEAESAWSELVSGAGDERVTTKYMALVMNGININSLEAQLAADGDNKGFSGRWAARSYSAIDDSQVSVSDAEVKQFYSANKELYKREPSRVVSYVTFNVTPSLDDRSAIETRANMLAGELAKTEVSDVRALFRENRVGSIATTYSNAAQLPSAESSDLVAGKVYGPKVSGDAWRISRVVESVYASDTLSLRHIVLPYTAEALADSLYTALKAGGDFAAAAATYSQFTESARNGGDVGAVPFASFDDEFSSALASARKGDIVKVAVGDMIQIINVYDASPRQKQYRVATIELPIQASEATRLAAHAAAGEFAVAANADYTAFANVAAESSVSPYTSVLTSSSRSINAVDGSIDVARWAHKAKVGDVSEIFAVADGYLVGVVTSIDKSEYESLENVGDIIRLSLINKKKYDLVASQISGSTFDEQMVSFDAKSGEFSNVSFSSSYITGVGVEPAVIGAISATTECDVVSAPIAGTTGVYIFEVSSISDDSEPLSMDAARVNLEATTQRRSQQQLFGVLESLGDIKDMRGAVL